MAQIWMNINCLWLNDYWHDGKWTWSSQIEAPLLNAPSSHGRFLDTRIWNYIQVQDDIQLLINICRFYNSNGTIPFIKSIYLEIRTNKKRLLPKKNKFIQWWQYNSFWQARHVILQNQSHLGNRYFDATGWWNFSTQIC
jgi:hypothetical protein